MKFSIDKYIKEHQNVIKKLDKTKLTKVIDLIFQSYLGGKKIFIKARLQYTY